MTTQTKSSVTQSANDQIDLGKLIGLLLDDKWRILIITMLFAAVGVAFALFSTPIYKSDALIQVEDKKGGMSQLLSEDMGDLFGGESSATTEIEIINSRMILGKTVESLNLTTSASPNYFPIIGKGWARRTGNQNSIEVSRFDVPEYLKPITSPLSYTLVITNAEAGEYQLVSNGEQKTLLNGKVGELAKGQGYKLFVQSLKGKAEDSFTIQKVNEIDAIGSLKQSLSVSEKGKQTGILQLSYTGEKPKMVEAILNSIAQNYFLQNVERQSAEAEKSLSFLKGHLPDVKKELDSAEGKLNNYRQSHDSIDLTLEAKATLQSMVQLESQLNDLKFKESELSQKFTKDHPAYKSLLQQKAVLLKQKHDLEVQVQNMPETQREILRMTRDVEVNQQIYVQLLNKVQELNILKAGTVGNVRILDNARTYTKPVKPKKPLIAVLATLLGGMFGVAITLIQAALHRGIENPDEIEELGLPVYASIPDSKEQKLLDVRYSKKKRNKHGLLAAENPADLAIEALRSLRTSLHFAMLESKNNIVAISGPAPSVGKSFITANFGTILAQAGQKVLVIDADLRKGHLIRYFKAKNDIGLSEVITNKGSLEQAIQQTSVEGLDVLVRGQVPPNPSELLMHSRFAETLELVSEQYDIVLIDTPPILAVTDPSIIAKHAGTTLMVGRFGQNTIKEIEVAQHRFNQAGTEVKGFILNAVEKKASNSYGYGYGYYNYAYESDKA
ncbi:polysaccharide biosynthesis tyrosine autokinase [Parashewanella curva]|uniref:Polysaccharide biosynthesis tyrosine autokinase n=1 Tax=Parashewanella curva TaxID=2338552 RepID=A0A3L8Q244_9GAMM|nr:polysaccharide biosynthesis tyrosine autokinase [Parashewanella curva]RLV60382.1 polysaccharide biosynthesis tyrosine autokinase [Parashewanella curva]